MKNQPKIKLNLTNKDKTVEIIAILVLLLIWLLPLMVYEELPNEIAIHFNAQGIPDNYGHKSTLFILPVVSSLLFILLTVLNKYPHTFNYPTVITEENAERQYMLSTRFMRFLKLAILIVFLVIVYKTIEMDPEGLGVFFMPFVLLITFVPIIIYLVKVMEKNKS
ncbi:DUF1648 domain-containing protein [Flammeovirga sp. SJP92]|uniref:DUF1648 domain-containing protein n=1 Tax=Flammeovirga sp. SJP92 TaxID=1775430 RepID=UPI000788BD6E|nr:DUF1648 domain-containing protein [Flammeovirga sp. SJP92]KXX71318.1 hypothetical protein AVL50_06840 [Flammeovirga sp. SJP92]